LPAGARVHPADITDEGDVVNLFDAIGAFDHLACTATQTAAGRIATLEAAAVHDRRRDPRRRRRGARVMRAVVIAVAIAACAPAVATVPRPPAPGSLASTGTLAGTWQLVAANDRHADGTEVAAYGDDPRGLLIVDPDGRYSLQIYRADRPRFGSNVKSAGTADEYRAASLGSSAHYGTCSVNEVAHMLEFRIAAASYPNWEGTVQRRPFTLDGDVLRYEVPATAGNTGSTPISVWRRVPPGSR
jgi:hypothetical protein